jgi:hypothetical protein
MVKLFTSRRNSDHLERILTAGGVLATTILKFFQGGLTAACLPREAPWSVERQFRF